MNRCIAVKRKGSMDACAAKPLRGHTMCGRHAKMRNPVLWSTANTTRISPIVKIQACVRRWLIYRRLSYAGLGVLSRKNLTNDEDIITYTHKDSVHPMDYFSFEENGKTWWFEFGSLWTWSMRNVIPANPYTKVPLATETRKRLRSIWGYKRRHREDIPLESLVFEERLRHRLNVLTHHFEDYGFEGVHPDAFIRFSKADYITLFVLLRRDIETVIPSSDPFRQRIAVMCDNRTRIVAAVQSTHYVLQCIATLLHILSLYRDPYVLTFSILSAFYRC